MKTIKSKKSENLLPKKKPSEVHIKVIFDDDNHWYKDLDLVTNSDELMQRIESYKMILESDGLYRETVYNELLNNAFRPKIELNLICNSILNFVCCHHSSEFLMEKLLERGDETIEISVNVNVESNSHSRIGIIPKLEENGKRISFFNVFEKTNLKLSIPSKLDYLNPEEKMFLIRIVKLILKSGDTCLRFDYDQLWDFFMGQIDDAEQSEYNDEYLSGIIDTLIFYEFISYSYDENYDEESDAPTIFKIMVFDLDIYGKYFEFVKNNHTA